MNWRYVTDDDGAEWQECDLGRIGLLLLDTISGRHTAIWLHGDIESVIAAKATEAEAKEAARDWLRLVIAQLGNVVAMGEQGVDEE